MKASKELVVHAQDGINWVSRWIPPGLLGTLILLLAGLVAASLCRLVLRGLERVASRFGDIPPMVVTHTKGPSSALFILFVLGATLPLAPFSPSASATIAHLLLAASVLVFGWAVTNTLDFFADFYVQRVRFDQDNNILARKHVTQVNVLRGAARTMVVLLTLGIALMTSQSVRQYGVSLFASAGAAGLVVGLAARPLLSNLLAGIQIAMTQPIRLEDSVIVQGEFGFIERIGGTYVVVRTWDLRRLIFPLTYFIENPFQNWTHASADLLGTVMVHVDYGIPVDKVREKLQDIVKDNPKWDGKVAVVQMTDLPAEMVELRLLVSARNAGSLFDLRCAVREGIVAWLATEYPWALPRRRMDIYTAKAAFGEVTPFNYLHDVKPEMLPENAPEQRRAQR